MELLFEVFKCLKKHIILLNISVIYLLDGKIIKNLENINRHK